MKHLQDYINEAVKINEGIESKTITFDFTDLENGEETVKSLDGQTGISVDGLKVGDTVLVYGNIYSYYGSLQVGSNITVSVVEDRGIEVPDYTSISVQEWENSFEIGYLGGKLYSIYAKLETGSNGLTSDSYRLVDPYTGEVAWIESDGQTDRRIWLYRESEWTAGCGNRKC